MSLHNAAQHLAAHGRGDDKVLVHMTHGEVKSLNDIAKAHGGQLSINPHTGLPEAGFLSAILPMVAGAGLMAVSGGAINPMTAGLIVGGLRTAQSGSLSKGIMAGLGAYGGAGLANSFGTAGAVSQAAPSAGQAVAADTDAMARAAQATQGVQSSAVPSIAQTTGNVATSSTPLSNSAYWDTGMPPSETGTRLVGSQGPMNVAGTQPIQAAGGPQYNIDGMGLSYPTTTPPSFADMNAAQRAEAIRSGASFSNAADWAGQNKMAALGAATSVAAGMQKEPQKIEPDKDMGQRYSFTGGKLEPTPAPDVPTYEDMMRGGNFGRQQRYFGQPTYTPISATAAKDLYHFAGGGPVEQMSNENAIGANTGFPQSNLQTPAYSTPYQTPVSQNVVTGPSDTRVDPFTGEERMATGGISDAHYNLGGYSDGGRLLRGPGDGVSDSIPATIGKRQPARLADGEFVVPARIVSELGNGSTEAGARKLYAMLDRVQAARKKTIGKGKVAHNSRADKYLPA